MTEAMQAQWNEFVESAEGKRAWNLYAVMSDDRRSLCWIFHMWMDVKTDDEVLALKTRIAELERLSASQSEAMDMMERGSL